MFNHSIKFSKNFCYKHTNNQSLLIQYSPFFTNLYEFKIITSKLLQEKKFHFSVLNYDVEELISLDKISIRHSTILSEIIKSNKIKFDENRTMCLEGKYKLINISSISLSYLAFLELLKFFQEKKEENINNVIRDMLEKGYKNIEVQKKLVLLRDEWREAFPPDILDENLNPLQKLNTFDQISLEINKKLFDVLI